MRVPDDVGEGKAKVTASFPAWKEGNVAPGSFEVDVIGAQVADAEQRQRDRRRKLALKAHLENALKAVPFEREAMEHPQPLSTWLDYFTDRFDVPFRVEPPELKDKDGNPALEKPISLHALPAKQTAQYLKEWLEQVDATYEVGEGFIRIVPSKSKKR